MRGFKIANAQLAKPIKNALGRYTALEAQGAKVPIGRDHEWLVVGQERRSGQLWVRVRLGRADGSPSGSDRGQGIAARGPR